MTTAVLLASLLAAGPLDTVESQVLRFRGATLDKSWKCSAVVLSDGYALTAAHCVDEPGAEFTIAGRTAEAVKKNRILDIAVVRFLAKDAVPMPLAPSTPSVGAEVAIAGFAAGMPDLYLQFGHVARPRDPDGQLVLNVEAFHGDSGGAVLDKRGRLVGIISARYDDGGGATFTYAIPVDQIRDFAAEYLPKAHTP